MFCSVLVLMFNFAAIAVRCSCVFCVYSQLICVLFTGDRDTWSRNGHLQSNGQSTTVQSWLPSVQQVCRPSQDQTGTHSKGEHSH